MNLRIRFFASSLFVLASASVLHLGCSTDDSTPSQASPDDAGKDSGISGDAEAERDAAGEDGGTSSDAGERDAKAPLPTCAEKGGECVPVVPGACDDGTIDPEGDCGGVGSSCCIPKAAPSCKSLGGKCVPVVPGACDDGTIDPEGDCGGVGSSCCIPADGG